MTTILDILSKEYGRGAYPGRSSEGLSPEWDPSPFRVLMATILSQRTKDNNTRKASDALFKRFDSVEAIANADLSEISELIRPSGFPNQKGKALIDVCNILIKEHGSEVPSDIDELLALPMVGRKTANCVRAYAFGLQAICVDTHVHRISNLMGLVRTRNPDETEFELMGITPEDRWSDINRYMVRHGQVICLPNNPRCGKCSVADLCAGRKCK
ncbi:MAG: endonuclease III [Methanomassiliicoccaceae archaeon]|jgi:endonuclease-3|nr:endonuclease III [Methanomassiliicoccaceae archaeon]